MRDQRAAGLSACAPAIQNVKKESILLCQQWYRVCRISKQGLRLGSGKNVYVFS